jgi:serine phosphatase RsbU (regulator of sigma subunit)
MATLQVIQGSLPGRSFELKAGESVIGRSPECDLVLDVAAVSRRHAVLIQQQGKYFVKDNGSRNGTLVNDVRIVGNQELKHGDQLTICDVILRYLDPAAVTSPSQPVHQPRLAGSLLGPRGEDEEGVEGESTIMATLDVSGGPSTSWHSSANPEVQLQAMIEISNSLGNTLALEEIFPKLLDSLFKIFVQADRGFVIMQSQAEGPLVPVAVKARRGDEDRGMRFSRTVVQRAMQEQQAILSANATTDERFGMAESISDIQIRSLICAPLINSDGESMGVLQIDTSDQRSRFTDKDLQVLAGVASQAAIAIDNAQMHEQAIQQRALQRDLEVAHQMQHALLPAAAPTVPGYFFFQHYEAAYQVGGDYYDYIALPDDRFAAVVGDVAGKGVSAAILMAKLSSDVRFWLAREADPAVAMGHINSAFCRHGWDDRFVTMIVAVLDPAAGQLTLVNAGHMPPLLRTADRKVQEIGGEEAGLPIGVIDDFEFSAYESEFRPGDFLTLFTDGFSEAMNSRRELFGLERLAELAGDPDVAPEELGPHILSQVRRFAGDFPQSDDMCLVCFGRQ